MTYPYFRLARGLLAGTAAMMLATALGTAAGATELQSQQTVTNHQRLEQAWSTEGQPIPTTAKANGLYTVQTGDSATRDSALTLDGNHQSTEIVGNTAASTLTATTVHADGDGAYEPSPFAVLNNRQSGDNIVTATSRMTVVVPGEIGNSGVTLWNNANTALARMNDAANTVTVETVGLSGDVLLNSRQSASGKVTAKTVSGVTAGNPDAAVQSARETARDNGAGSEADGNRVLNSLKAEAATVMGGRPVLDSRQTNAAAIIASTSASFTVKGSGVIRSAIGIDGNSAASLVRGNVAENRMIVSGGVGNGGDYPGGGDVPSLAATYAAPTSAGAVLSNRQVNNGAVTAKTNVAAGVALNCGCTSDSQIGVADNAGSASAYGNTVLNAATVDGMPTALVSNAQVNRGPISATVTGRFGALMTGGVNASVVTVSGNSLAATAIGNQAVNSLTATGNLGAGLTGAQR